ncbi:hypothetical protein HUJ04_000362 [Dendroctonus ponderosae]|uniref:Uncharacterized protein n=1 Tax=Dendroctonus ponderosae TaxID=77166 RepID=A0AAR5P0W7_DENPD|nr:hypothetical protein HUJ04_000362 [Dendroctonus ponderosae]
MMFMHKCLYALLMSSLVLADSLADFFSLLSPEKNDLMKTFIEIEEFRNFTLIGSENVYAENGKLVEIRTIELHWPKYPFWHENNLKNLTAFYSSTSNIDYREYDESGNLTAETFAGDNVKFVITDGHKLLEKSITLESVDLVEEAIKQLEITDGNLSVLKYDENGQFINDGSKIIPEYLVRLAKYAKRG